MNNWLYRLAERIVRPRTKDRIGVYHGVAARDSFVFDAADHHPEHKVALVASVREYTRPQDKVVCVGGGRGIVPVWAAREGATVTVYEAAREMVDIARETMRINGVSESVEVRHAAVGDVIDPYGDISTAGTVAPEELSTADVLVLDCEGAETGILDELDSERFESIVVETHPEFGAPTERVLELTGGEVVAPDSHDGHVVVA